MNRIEIKKGKSEARELNRIRRAYRTASSGKKRQLKQIARETAARIERNKSSGRQRENSE
ncbi:MAG: hypothetical protein OES09_17940 [Gammaproteobacteria bacterium]|nr:hypothetical protein [Gammaproteobacteria bacterium]